MELLERAFERQPISVSERHIPEGTDDLVCLVNDGAVTALTPLSTLREAFLMVTVDRYRSGTRQSETGEFPEVLTGLDEVEFTVRGFPQSNKEKRLLVFISRFIEHRALSRGAGEFHSAFQRLSRLDDLYVTRTIDELLAESDVAIHIYGRKDDPGTVEYLVWMYPSTVATPRIIGASGSSYSPPSAHRRATTRWQVTRDSSRPRRARIPTGVCGRPIRRKVSVFAGTFADSINRPLMRSTATRRID